MSVEKSAPRYSHGTISGTLLILDVQLTSLLETIDHALSSPRLSPQILKVSKAYLLLLPSPSGRERIAGCAIAQQIFSAMNVVSTPPVDAAADQKKLVSVEGGLYCR
jgi:N-acetyltransferase